MRSQTCSMTPWRRVSDYAIRKENFVICKAFVMGKAVYTLTSDDLSIIERFASADEAKLRAEQFLSGNGRPAGGAQAIHAPHARPFPQDGAERVVK